METDVALVVDQLKVEDCPLVIVGGDAEKETVGAAGALLTAMFTDALGIRPELSHACTTT